MFYDENEDYYFIKNYLKREDDTTTSKKDTDFPLDIFDSILQNLMDMYQVDEKIGCFIENLREMRKLVNHFPSIIFPIFQNRGIFNFLIELIKTPIIEIQTDSLEIASKLICGHEDVIELYGENEIFPIVLNFFASENTLLANAASKFFSFSIRESPSKFLGIFINDFLQEFINLYKKLDKDDVSSRIAFSMYQVFYTLFDKELNVDVEVLEMVYQNILLDLYKRKFYFFFLQFVEDILQVTERDHFYVENSKEKEFIIAFYETDFPLRVSKLIHKCFDKSSNIVIDKVSFNELNKSLILIAKLFNKGRIFSRESEDSFKRNMFNDIEENISLLKCVSRCFSIDIMFEEHGKSFLRSNEEDDEEENEKLAKIDPYLFDDISINAVHVFISFVKLFKDAAVTKISNYRIISDFADHPDKHSYLKKNILTELCLNILEYCSDDQFKAYFDCCCNTPLLLTILNNINPIDKNHLIALNRMIDSIPKRNNFCFSLLKNYHHFLVQAYDDISENNSNANEIVPSLYLLIQQIEKEVDEAGGFDEEGKISDDE